MHTKKSEMGCQKECLTTKTRQFLNPIMRKKTHKKKTEPINKLVEISTKINKLTIYICINLLNP
jgi:hypothetical protein